MGMQVPVERERERIGVGCCEFVLGAHTAARVIPTLPHMTWPIWLRYYDQAKKILGMPLP